MTKELHYNTVNPYLLNVLMQLMSAKEFASFRLVGGTSLSLQRGHRISIDIDLFTDAEYGSIDFDELDRSLRQNYKYVDTAQTGEPGMGRSYFVGRNKEDCVKLDIFYTDPFIFPALEMNGIRLATIEEIIAMKLEVIIRGGRKKDFWDLHELTGDLTLKQMLELHEKRHPYSHDAGLIKKQFSNFSKADNDGAPDCLRGHTWELIKLDMQDFSKT